MARRKQDREAAAGTDKIREGFAKIHQDLEGTRKRIATALHEKWWARMGYDSWQSYCDGEFSTIRSKLSAKDHATVVLALCQEDNLSLRAIATATGVSKDTVRRSVIRNQVSQNETPAQSGDSLPKPQAKVAGTDGKEYPKQRQVKTKPSGLGAFSNAKAATGTGRELRIRLRRILGLFEEIWELGDVPEDVLGWMKDQGERVEDFIARAN